MGGLQVHSLQDVTELVLNSFYDEFPSTKSGPDMPKIPVVLTCPPQLLHG